MKPIEINLASRPYRNDLPLGVLLGVVVALSFGLTAKNVYTYITADSRLEALDRELADHQRSMERIQTEAQRLKQELDAVDLDILQPQADFANAVLQERNFSWTLFFNALEDVLPWHTKLTSIRPHFDSGRVVIEVNATSQNYDGFLEFQRVLQASSHFDQVVPTGFETGKGSDRRVYFTLEFSYDPRTMQSAPAAGQEDRVADVETIVVGEDGEEIAAGKGPSGPASSGPGEAEMLGGPDVAVPREPEVLGAPRDAASGRSGGRAAGGGSSREGAVETGRKRRKSGKKGPGPRRFAAGAAGADAGSTALLPGNTGGRGLPAAGQAPLAKRPTDASTASSSSRGGAATGPAPDPKQIDAARTKLTPEQLKKLREDQVVYDKNGVPMIAPKIKDGPAPQLPKEVRDLLPDGHPAKGDSGQDTSGSSGQEGSGGDGNQSGGGSSGSGSGGGQP